MESKLSTLSRTTIVLLIATLASGIMVSTAVSARPQALVASQVIAGSLAA
jgi:hypothetical protein